MNNKNIPFSVQTDLIHVDNHNEWFAKHPFHPTKRELRKNKRKTKQIGNQLKRSKEKRELRKLNVKIKEETLL